VTFVHDKMVAHMRAWVYRKDKSDPSGIHIFEENLDIPRPAPNQVLIKVQKVSVCATDEVLFLGDLKRVPDGVIPGHEFYGEIVELGQEVRDVKIGQKIAGESHYVVPGVADQGIIGLWGPEIHKGESLPALGGGYAEYLCIPAECAHAVPGDLVSEKFWPSLFEAIGNDYFMIKRVHELKPQNLGLFGCGPHGLFAQIFARHFEIPRMAAFEIDPFRREFAANLKIADAIFDPSSELVAKAMEFTRNNLFDATIDLVGKHGQGFEACCETTRENGTIYLFGLFTDRFAIHGQPGNEIIFKMKELEYSHHGKRLKIVGITGREGIWEELIEMVCRDVRLQENLMKPVRVMGNLDRLGEDTRHPQKNILKRAYHAFQQ
jgi:threonine 3-dehydrogenase